MLGANWSLISGEGLYENTLIVYVNDNGWEQDPDQEFWDDPMRSHNGGDKGKGSIYDMSFRSPIIFSYPGRSLQTPLLPRLFTVLIYRQLFWIMQVLRCLQISLEKATAVYWKGTKNPCVQVFTET